MTIEEAKYLLSFHSSRNEDVKNSLWDNGFVELLRQFKGSKNLEKAFHQVMDIILVLSTSLEKELIEKEVIANLFTIVHMGKMWGYSSNNIFSSEEIKQIEDFVDHISYTFFCILDGAGIEVAFEMYYSDYPDIKSIKCVV